MRSAEAVGAASMDLARIAAAVREILSGIGEDPDREGLRDTPERVARMYAPQVTPEQVAHFTTDAPGDPSQLGQAISRYGVVGHSQTSARVRRNGKPLIIRRDFNTVDGVFASRSFTFSSASSVLQNEKRA